MKTEKKTFGYLDRFTESQPEKAKRIEKALDNLRKSQDKYYETKQNVKT